MVVIISVTIKKCGFVNSPCSIYQNSTTNLRLSAQNGQFSKIPLCGKYFHQRLDTKKTRCRCLAESCGTMWEFWYIEHGLLFCALFCFLHEEQMDNILLTLSQFSYMKFSFHNQRKEKVLFCATEPTFKFKFAQASFSCHLTFSWSNNTCVSMRPYRQNLWLNWEPLVQYLRLLKGLHSIHLYMHIHSTLSRTTLYFICGLQLFFSFIQSLSSAG